MSVATYSYYVRCDGCGASVHVHDTGPVQETCVDHSEAIISYLCPRCYMEWREDNDQEEEYERRP